jgi:hypothetical protein
LLDLDHLLVLGALLLQAVSLTVVLLGLGHLLHADGLLLVHAVLLISHHLFMFLLLALVMKSLFVLV